MAENVNHNNSYRVQAWMTTPDGNEVEGELQLEFTLFNEPQFKWRAQPPVLPRLRLQTHATPDPMSTAYRWTALPLSPEFLTVVMVDTAPPYGAFFLGHARSLDEAERLFLDWLQSERTLGPSRSTGEFGI